MIIETLLVVFAILLSAVAFCLGLIIMAKCWYYSWYIITFILIYVHQKGNYNFAQHKLLTK